MVNALSSFTSLSDDQLLAHIRALAERERTSTAALIAALAELDARRLYLGQGFSSLFAYCTQALRLSEDAAYNRIRAARVAAKWPMVLDLIENGSVTVTAVRLLSDVLTDTNHDELFRAATHKSKREVEAIVAALNPRPDVAPTIRKVTPPTLPAARPASDDAPRKTATSAVLATPCVQDTSPTPPAPVVKPAAVAPLSAERYKIQFTIEKTTHDKLRRVQDLMRHTNPQGDPAVIFDRALTVLLEQLEKARLGKTSRPRTQRRAPRPDSRHVPSAVKREVWGRDRGQCAFVGAAGRCSETGFLEYHHVTPYADGGETTIANIQLRCHAHNAYEAEEWFGSLVVREGQPRYDLGGMESELCSVERPQRSRA